MTRTRRRLMISVGVLATLALVFLLSLNLAARRLQAAVENALGPRSQVGATEIGWRGVSLRDVRVKAPPGWPAEEELRASRVHLTPDWRGLWGRGPWRISQVRVEGAYLSVLRTRQGQVRLLPALLEKPEPAQQPQRPRASEKAGSVPPEATGPWLEIGEVRLEDASLAFFDGSVRQPPWPLRIEKLDARVGPLVLPELHEPIRIDLRGEFSSGGSVAIEGTYTPARRDADLQARFSGVDMVALRPYLLKVSDMEVRRGTLDLDLQAHLRDNRLSAPGRLVLLNLELSSGGGPWATFAGVPSQLVLGALTANGRLEVRFTLEGRLDDPSFSLNESLATKIAAGMAESLGVSLSGVARGLGGMVNGLFRRGAR